MGSGVYVNQRLKGKEAQELVRYASIFAQIPTDQTLLSLEKCLQRFRQAQIEAEQNKQAGAPEESAELELI